MKFKVIAVIVLLFLCFFLGFEKIAVHSRETKNSEVAELNILNYLPKNNQLLFISDLESSNIIKSITKNFKAKDQEKIIQIKNSILAYLGIDIGNNKLEDIYNNELLISTYENDKETKDDILIIFKIKPEKYIKDLLNLSKQIKTTDDIVTINRDNKINYLSYIYQTKDDYIIASSNKTLIIESIESKNKSGKSEKEYYQEILSNFKHEHNILFRKRLGNHVFLSDKKSSPINEDLIATIFSQNNKNLVLKSFLINSNKNINILSYKDLIDEGITRNNNYTISAYNDFKNAFKYLSNLINSSEQSLLEEINQKFNQNILLLNHNKNWVIAFENNIQNKFNVHDIDQLKDFNKYKLEKNGNLYSIYSKDILEEEEDVIKQVIYKDIFLVETKDLFIISNNLINSINIDLISKEFFELKNNQDTNNFLYKKINIKGSRFINTQYLFYFDDLNFLFKDILNLSNIEIAQVIKQSFPEKNPIVYIQTKLEINQ